MPHSISQKPCQLHNHCFGITNTQLYIDYQANPSNYQTLIQRYHIKNWIFKMRSRVRLIKSHYNAL